MIKKLLSLACALIITITSLSVLTVNADAAKKNYYNPTLALTYASKNWNNGIGLCADFASKCIQAGGVNVYSSIVSDLYKKLNGTYGTSHKLTLTNGTMGCIKMSANEGKLEAGDLIFYYCNRCRSFTHVVVCNGANRLGYVQDYAHNNAHNGKKQTYTYFHCGTHNWTLYSINLYKEPPKYGKKTHVEVPEINFIKNGAGGVVIKWDLIAGADKYRVYRKTNTTSWVKLGDTKINSFTDKKIKNNVKYTYTVRAVDNNVYSQYYEGKSILALTPPSLKIGNGKGYIRVSWSKNSKADGYCLYQRVDGKWIRIAKITDPNVTTCKVNSVQSGKKYKFTVKPYKGKLIGSYVSSGISIRYLDYPKDITASPSAEGMLVTFSKIDAAKKYRVYRKATDETKWTSLGYTTETQFLDTTCVYGKSYQYTVKTVYAKTGSSVDKTYPATKFVY